MKRIDFWFQGEPVGKGRPRFTRQGRAYTPKKTRDYELKLAAKASDKMVDSLTQLLFRERSKDTN